MNTIEQPITGKADGVGLPAYTRRRPRISWFVPEPFDWALSALYLCVLINFVVRGLIVQGLAGFPWLGLAALHITVIGLVAIDRFEYWRYRLMPPARVAVLLLGVRLVLIEVINQIDGYGAGVFLYFIPPFIAVLSLNMRVAALLGVAVWLRFNHKLITDNPQWYAVPHSIENLLVFPAGVVFVLAMAQLVNSERRGRIRTENLLDELEQSNAQLTDYAEKVQALTIAAERSRLAREIHDSLGHYLTALNVQLRKATAFRDKDPAQANQAVQESKRLAHEALEDVRRSVGLLRNNDQPLSLDTALGELVAPFQGTLAVDVRVQGSDPGFSRATLLALYRGAQECLTNVQRHAQASRTTLALRFGAESVELLISDDGHGFDVDQLARLPPGRNDRYGLQGVRERIELVGGTIDIVSSPGQGTTVTIWAPRAVPGARLRMLEL